MSFAAFRNFCQKIISTKTNEQIKINSYLATRQIRKVFLHKIIHYLQYLLVNLSLMFFPFLYSKITGDISAIYAGYAIITCRMLYNFIRLTYAYLSYIQIQGLTFNPITIAYQMFYNEIYTQVSYELNKMNFFIKQIYKLGYGRSIRSITQSFYENLKYYFIKSLLFFTIQVIFAWSSYIFLSSQYITPFLYSAGELNIFSATIYPFYYSISYLFAILTNISFFPFIIFISLFLCCNAITFYLAYTIPYKKLLLYLILLLFCFILILLFLSYLFSIQKISPIVVAFLFTFLETSLFSINKRNE